MMKQMSSQADREARRARVRARLAAERAGTEIQTLTVAADALAAGDWLEKIESCFGFDGSRTRPQNFRALTIRDGGARVVAAIGGGPDGSVEVILDGRDGFVLPLNAPCVVRRRVRVDG